MKKHKPDNERPSELAGSAIDIFFIIVYAMATGGGVAMYNEIGAGPTFLFVGVLAAILIAMVWYVLRGWTRSQRD